jgi:hypothetical protein
VRLIAAFVLLALAVVAIPGPHALAQPPARPEPQELWRQFPLEQAPPKPQRESAPRGSSPTSPTPAEEGRDGSFANVWPVAIAVTTGLLLLLLIGEHVARRLRSAVAANGQLGIASRARRRSLKRAAARSLHGLGRITANFRKETVPASAEATRNELARLNDLPATYVAHEPAERSADEHVEKLKAKLEVQPITSDTGHDEVEILMAKRGKLAGSRDAGGPDEAEMLKAKAADNVAGKTRQREGARHGLEAASKQR